VYRGDEDGHQADKQQRNAFCHDAQITPAQRSTASEIEGRAMLG
jgi:hypothetical protein